MNDKTGLNARVETPNGPGLLWGRDDERMLVSHKPGDVPEAVRDEYWRGGPCFCVWYAVGEVSVVGA